MSALLTYTSAGRGAWPTGGRGGTLSADGTGPGRFYRSVAPKAVAPTVGLAGYRASAASATCPVDEYAVHRAVAAVQAELRERVLLGADGRPLTVDGLWGPNTDHAVRGWQARCGVPVDGVFGPVTSRALFQGQAVRAGGQLDPGGVVARILIGTIEVESRWDPGAVGASTPQDLGLGQLNGPAHPQLPAASRLDPRVALPYVAGLIAGNLEAFSGQARDAVAAYRYGRTGAREWVAAGRPQMWKNTDAWAYIGRVLNGGQ